MTPAVEFAGVSIAFDDTEVLRDVSFSVPTGHTAVFLGMSGSGKSVILKLILGLLKPDAGAISIDGARVDTMPEARMMRVRDGIGMLFQESALFDSLTVADNVGYRMYEQSIAAPDAIRRQVADVLALIGMEEHIDRMPAQLSGGQRRRVAFARAIAARPHLLLLDEPTSGLDPLTAKTVCGAIIRLRDLHRVTSIIATHQLPDAFYIATHQAVARSSGDLITPAERRAQSLTEFFVLKDARIYFRGTAADLLATADPYLASMLSGWVPPLAA